MYSGISGFTGSHPNKQEIETMKKLFIVTLVFVFLFSASFASRARDVSGKCLNLDSDGDDVFTTFSEEHIGSATLWHDAGAYIRPTTGAELWIFDNSDIIATGTLRVDYVQIYDSRIWDLSVNDRLDFYSKINALDGIYDSLGLLELLDDVLINLSDNAGSGEVSVTDSDDTEVFSVDSDGNLATSGTAVISGYTLITDSLQVTGTIYQGNNRLELVKSAHQKCS